MKADSDPLVIEIMEFLWRENPVEATMVGIHRYDDCLEKLDQVHAGGITIQRQHR